MKNANVIDAETVPDSQRGTMAVQRIESGAVSARAMTVEELHANLEFIRNVMRKEMKSGQDYGKIPGTGDKPTLLQPGAQKLLMTFNLTVSVKKEMLREYPGFHREYEFTLTIKAQNGKEWDGIGTCSTLESKYRYRKSERKCPQCGKDTIIKGKAEYGGGWLCWKKKGGCDAKFEENEPRITSQAVGQVENENPADQWNTVRKMSFKRALVAGTINATNTSELWTQDLEENAPLGETDNDNPPPAKASQKPSGASRGGSNPTQARKEAPAPPSGTARPKIFATEETRSKLIVEIAKADLLHMATEYFRKLPEPVPLMPLETLESLPLRFVPTTTKQMWALMKAIRSFADGDQPVHAYAPNEEAPAPPPPEKPKERAKPAPETKKPIEVPRDENPDPDSPDAPWRTFPVPFGPDAGTPMAKLNKKKLWGWWANYEVKETWEGSDGRIHDSKPEKVAADKKFRAMLDEAAKHYGFTKEEDESEPLETVNPALDDVPF